MFTPAAQLLRRRLSLAACCIPFFFFGVNPLVAEDSNTSSTSSAAGQTEAACQVARMTGYVEGDVVSVQICLEQPDGTPAQDSGIYRLLIVDPEGGLLAESDPQPVLAGKVTRLSFILPEHAAQIQLKGPDNAVSAHLNVSPSL